MYTDKSCTTTQILAGSKDDKQAVAFHTKIKHWCVRNGVIRNDLHLNCRLPVISRAPLCKVNVCCSYNCFVGYRLSSSCLCHVLYFASRLVKFVVNTNFWQCYGDFSLFQALCQCGRLKKRAGDERGLFSIVLSDREPGTGFHQRKCLGYLFFVHLVVNKSTANWFSFSFFICF